MEGGGLVNEAGRVMMETIAVVCKDTRHARGKVAQLGLFGRRPGSSAWEMWPGRGMQTVDAEGRPFDKFSRSTESIWPRRDRYRLACDLCKSNVTVTSETLSPFLDGVWANGQRVVTLDYLAAMLI